MTTTKQATKHFSIDGDGLYGAVSFGKPWNGWETPVVTRLFADMGWTVPEAVDA